MKRILLFAYLIMAAFAFGNAQQYAPSFVRGGVEWVDAFVDIQSPSAIPLLTSHGAVVGSEFDGFVTAQIPVWRLEEISSLPGVLQVERSRMLEMCTDSTLSMTHAGQVIDGYSYGLPMDYDGTGIIIGIIDAGFDYQHVAFKHASDLNRTRISRVYSTTDTTGHPVIVNGSLLSGSVFIGEQIDTLTTDKRENSHGTHTASIAAGLHINGFGGMAPGAELVLCASASILSTMKESEIVDCLKYIYAYADSVGKPCVVSISVSTRQGPHDGTDRLSKAVAQLTGPGRIFVIAAGNNADIPHYAGAPVTLDKPMHMLIGNYYYHADDSYRYDFTWLDMYDRLKSKPAFRFHILDKQTKRIVWQSEFVKTPPEAVPVSAFSDYYVPIDSTQEAYIKGKGVYELNIGKYELQAEFRNLKCKEIQVDTIDGSPWITSRYQIGVSVYPPAMTNPNGRDSCFVDTWLCTSNGRRTVWTEPIYVDRINDVGELLTDTVYDYYVNPNNYCSINSNAVHDSIISAGGYDARSFYRSLAGDTVRLFPYVGIYLYNSSFQREGYGPTGQALPTITAPAYYVVAAVSRYSQYAYKPEYNSTVSEFQNNYWGVMTGTSMAAPTVAGIIAQWLQINPNLSPSQVKQVLAETAIKDDYTLSPVFGFRFGPNGKIDAMAGARYLLEHEGVNLLVGDVDGDGTLSIKDLTALIDILLDYNESDELPIDADVDRDRTISIKDLTAMIDMLLDYVSPQDNPEPEPDPDPNPDPEFLAW